jgi:hypothetical protein
VAGWQQLLTVCRDANSRIVCGAVVQCRPGLRGMGTQPLYCNPGDLCHTVCVNCSPVAEVACAECLLAQCRDRLPALVVWRKACAQWGGLRGACVYLLLLQLLLQEQPERAHKATPPTGVLHFARHIALPPAVAIQVAQMPSDQLAPRNHGSRILVLEPE